MAVARLNAQDTALLVVDLQTGLLPHILGHDGVVDRACRMIRGARVCGLPVMMTEQNPAKLGATAPAVADALGPDAWSQSKMAFSACTDGLLDHLGQTGRSTLLVCGIETHVCVLQTCLDLQAKGVGVAVLADAAGSRRQVDHQAALDRLRDGGVMPVTVEMALLEMIGRADSGLFKAVLPIIK